MRLNPTDQDILGIIERSGNEADQAKIIKVLLPFTNEDYVYSRIRTLEARGLIVKTGAEYRKGRTVTLTEAGREALQQAQGASL